MSGTPSFAVVHIDDTVRVCSQCGALIYDRDDAEDAHRNWHEGLVTGDHLLALAKELDRG